MTPVVEPAAGAFGSHPTMFPVIEAKRKFAPHGADAQAPGRTKSAATGFATVPVGRPPGMVTVWGDAFRTNGAPLGTSPRSSCVVLVPLLATQNGLEAVWDMPHGLTSKGSSTGARPGISDIRFVWRYAEPGGMTGMFGSWPSGFTGAVEALDAGADGITGNMQRY